VEMKFSLQKARKDPKLIYAIN